MLVGCTIKIENLIIDTINYIIQRPQFSSSFTLIFRFFNKFCPRTNASEYFRVFLLIIINALVDKVMCAYLKMDIFCSLLWDV